MGYKKFKWELCPEDRSRAEGIVDRFVVLCAREELPAGDWIDLLMDLIVTHNHACPLDFEKLLAADDFNLMHDCMGIKNCLNRTTGKLERCFLPRCAMPQPRG